MKLSAINEGRYDSLSMNIDEIVESLENKILIIFSINVTDINPNSRHSQIINISALAISADSGNTIDAYNEHVSLSIAVLREIDRQDHLQMPSDNFIIKDMLNAVDYDLSEYESGNTDYPDEMEAVLGFKSFVEQYSGQAILITYDSKFTMMHLNNALPFPLKAPVFDISKFIKLYFEPALKTQMMHGQKSANAMADKMVDKLTGRFNFALNKVGKALGVRKSKLHIYSTIDEIQYLANTFRAMLKYLRKYKKTFNDLQYKNFAAAALQRIKR